MQNNLIRGLAAAALGLTATAATAQDDWPSEPITWVVPYSPGGGFDSYTRAVAPELERILGTEVVVENIPGAGGQRGASTVYRAEPDGYTIGIWNVPGLTVPQLLGQSKGYDLTDVTWIGNLATSRYALGVQAGSEYESLEDLCAKDEPFLHSDTGPASTSSVTARVAMSTIDCEVTNVTGYQGSTDTVVGLMRGEVDATIKPIATLLPYAESGDVEILMTFEDERSLPDVPTSTELGFEGFSNFTLRRIVGGPPGIPEDIQQRLSDALMEAANSDAVQEWSESSNRPLDPVGADEAAQIMADMMDFYEQYKDAVAID